MCSLQRPGIISRLAGLTLPRLVACAMTCSMASSIFWASPAKAESLLQVRGTLNAEDLVLEDGSWYDRYVFSGNSGQRVTIVLESQDFDPYLILLDANGKRISENDDTSRSDRNARLSIELPATGTYTVVANSYEPGKTGGYTLKIERDTLLSPEVSAAAIAAASDGSSGCDVAVVSTIENIKTSRDLGISLNALRLADFYSTVPSARPNGIKVALSGPAAASVIFSPQFLTQVAADLIQGCASVGAVVFDTPSAGVERTFGYLPDRPRASRSSAVPVSEFACALAPREVETPDWGYQTCL
ncbi:MAG: hypothetical protein DCF15_15880 [Phormidesmis priestleyi]|uniref:Peptidase C-terminal archaeal/bacterial domain-containing protein n=1 Tax=Phormidesmis priestleyi TaxID=268141 RepID=A0A2W4WZB7_9CYAN|nr:MAG: hypothetical protein DCF15_15880 [Phormidesmis priestleyi]